MEFPQRPVWCWRSWLFAQTFLFAAMLSTLCLMAQSCYLGSWEGVCTSHPLPWKLLRAGVLSQLLCLHRPLGLVTVFLPGWGTYGLVCSAQSPVLVGVRIWLPEGAPCLAGELGATWSLMDELGVPLLALPKPSSQFQRRSSGEGRTPQLSSPTSGKAAAQTASCKQNWFFLNEAAVRGLQGLFKTWVFSDRLGMRSWEYWLLTPSEEKRGQGKGFRGAGVLWAPGP